MSGEYNNSMTSSGCSYASLASYNRGYSMGVAPKGKQISGSYVVPTWSPISVDSLTGRNGPSPSGYGNITSAYGKGAGQCQTTYSTSLCGQ